jgi:hypothetical protein
VITNFSYNFNLLLAMMNLEDLQKNLAPELLLSTKQMSFVKGGNSNSGSSNSGSSNPGSVNSANSDDKRRERPGGGIG